MQPTSASTSIKGSNSGWLRRWVTSYMGIDLPMHLVMLQKLLNAGHVIKFDAPDDLHIFEDTPKWQRMVVDNIELHQHCEVEEVMSMTGVMETMVTDIKRHVTFKGWVENINRATTLSVDLNHFITGAITLSRLQEKTWLVKQLWQ